jgi:signal peptidase I
MRSRSHISGRGENVSEAVGKKAENPWRETAKIIAQAVVIAMVVRVFLFQPFNIPSGSMKSTLLVGDYLFVSKLSYGYSRYSFPWDIIPFKGRIFATEPKRGDVAVFKLPRDNSTDYIKRIIGLPGAISRFAMASFTLMVSRHCKRLLANTWAQRRAARNHATRRPCRTA